MNAEWVTNRQYAAFMEATGHRQPIIWTDLVPIHPDYPVLGVSQKDARAYCAWAGCSLLPYDEQPEIITLLWTWCAEEGVSRGCSWDNDRDYSRLEHLPSILATRKAANQLAESGESGRLALMAREQFEAENNRLAAEELEELERVRAAVEQRIEAAHRVVLRQFAEHCREIREAIKLFSPRKAVEL